jgi:uncharacterized protein YjbI with pentapeptide repeats
MVFMEHEQRWLSEDGQRLAAQVIKRLWRGKSLDGLGLPTVKGRIDLRGLSLPEPEFTPHQVGRLTVGVAERKLPEIRKARMQGLDLRESRLRHLRLLDVRMVDCDLSDADLTDFAAWRSTFEDCDLSGADLTDALLSSLDKGVGNVWHNCRFNASKLDGIVAKWAEFRGCSFENVTMADMVFGGCSFIDCRMTGSLNNVAFYGTEPDGHGKQSATMENFDLRDCQLTAVDFTGLRMSGVRLPPNGRVVILPGATRVLEGLRSALAGMPDSEVVLYLSSQVDYLLKHVQPDDDLYLDYDNISMGGGEASVAMLKDLVAQAAS